MIRNSELNNNDNTSPTRPFTVKTVQKSTHHAVTSIKGKYTTNYLNLTEHLINFVFEHARKCKDADRELEAILTTKTNEGVENSC